MKLLFGKYYGREIEDIPTSYLEWALENCRNLSPSQQREIARLLKVDDPEFYPPAPSIEPLIKPWYRRLATEFHPDRRNGSHVGMLAINRAKELLLELVKEAAI